MEKNFASAKKIICKNLKIKFQQTEVELKYSMDKRNVLLQFLATFPWHFLQQNLIAGMYFFTYLL